MAIENIPVKSNLNAVSDTTHQLSAEEVNTIVSAIITNKNAIATIKTNIQDAQTIQQYTLTVINGELCVESNMPIVRNLCLLRRKRNHRSHNGAPYKTVSKWNNAWSANGVCHVTITRVLTYTSRYVYKLSVGNQNVLSYIYARVIRRIAGDSDRFVASSSSVQIVENAHKSTRFAIGWYDSNHSASPLREFRVCLTWDGDNGDYRLQPST